MTKSNAAQQGKLQPCAFLIKRNLDLVFHAKKGFRIEACLFRGQADKPWKKRWRGGMAADVRQGLWDFALRLYGAPDVGDACLVLQDESGVDVPVLLFSAWLAKHSVALSQAEIARIDGLVADWRNEVVRPLRAIRRRLKSGPHPAPTKETETLRNGVKGVELSSEKIELSVLEAEGQVLISAGTTFGDAGSNLLLVLHHFRGSELDAKAAEALAVVEKALAAL
jgi:uncharacterized protein (TIGR02444 family)